MMSKRVLSVLVVLAMFSAVHAEGAVILFKTTMDGPSENPAVPSPGTGKAVVAYDSVAQTLSVSIQFQDLVGTTTVAHIHCCVDPPGTVGVATFPGTFPGFPAGVTSGAYAGSWDLSLTTSYTAAFLTAGGGTAAGAEAALLAGMLAGRAYVNVHTTFAPGGEIRGFLREAPEPGALLLLGLGGAVVAARRKRRSPVA